MSAILQAKPEVLLVYSPGVYLPLVCLTSMIPIAHGRYERLRLCTIGICLSFRCEYGGAAFGPANEMQRLDLGRCRTRCHFPGDGTVRGAAVLIFTVLLALCLAAPRLPSPNPSTGSCLLRM
ncbi:hypothetical protein BKA93DRAFT_142482 [Sparassis latifolia]